MHDVRADRLILSGGPRNGRPAWWNWTVAEHLAHQAADEPAPAHHPVQAWLFEAPTPVQADQPPSPLPSPCGRRKAATGMLQPRFRMAAEPN
ncbi:hypothetical protein [Streptomyces mirabilis]|uniref:hypothetical protein n=1 Tax=Streptomyces mirabilis TaxID=68239 RepID=UPI0036A72E64